jgi:hypothetical protein
MRVLDDGKEKRQVFAIMLGFSDETIIRQGGCVYSHVELDEPITIGVEVQSRDNIYDDVNELMELLIEDIHEAKESGIL